MEREGEKERESIITTQADSYNSWSFNKNWHVKLTYRFYSPLSSLLPRKNNMDRLRDAFWFLQTNNHLIKQFWTLVL